MRLVARRGLPRQVDRVADLHRLREAVALAFRRHPEVRELLVDASSAQLPLGEWRCCRSAQCFQVSGTYGSASTRATSSGNARCSARPSSSTVMPSAGASPTSIDVARADVTFFDDAQVRAEAPRELELLDERRVAHAHPELEARQARLRDLEDRRADAPSRADHRRAEIEAAHGEVLAERPGLDRAARAPPTTTRSPRPRTRRPPCRGHRARGRSACSSPSRLTPRTATRPSTGDFQMPVSTSRPCHSTVRRAPTFTDTTTPARSQVTGATVRGWQRRV